MIRDDIEKIKVMIINICNQKLFIESKVKNSVKIIEYKENKIIEE
jgi:hypothetical protein